jgi:hypothetical protein
MAADLDRNVVYVADYNETQGNTAIFGIDRNTDEIRSRQCRYQNAGIRYYGEDYLCSRPSRQCIEENQINLYTLDQMAI